MDQEAAVSPSRELTRSYELLARAERVVAGGVPGFRSVRQASYGRYPQFFHEGRAGRLIDVDGNEYVDYLCGFGPILLGYRHPAVDAAVREQAQRGTAFSFPSERYVELAELLVERIDFASWVMFGKNGSDATDFALRLARTHTGRETLLTAEEAYHTFHPWGCPDPTGVPAAWRSGVDHFEFDDPVSVERAFARHPGDVAAVMLTPFRHDPWRDQQLPSAAYVSTVRELCDREGALLILDDIRAAFRCHSSGPSHRAWGWQPDLACYGKAIGNGEPLSVVAAREELREAAQRVSFSATHFFSGEPMAAAIATLTAFDAEHTFEHMQRYGQALVEGLRERAAAAGLAVHLSGPPAIPFLRFDGDSEFERAIDWCGEMAQRGVIVHPYHNWFVCGAHSDEDLSLTLDAAEESFAKLAA
jgi:glutamate-1-semialdehyde 2,1-aminomutase